MFAICDYLDHGVVDEFRLFAELFEQRGFRCIVADVRDLAFDGQALHDAAGTRIDAIWRRSVTNNINLAIDELGLKTSDVIFDDWASNFGETITAIELSPEGTGYRAKTRF